MLYRKNNKLIQYLKGDVSWIFCDTGFGNYLRVIARVNGRLVGLTFEQKNYTSNKDYYKNIVIDTMARKSVLSLVRFQEVKEQCILLTPSEQQEYDELCKQDEIEKAKIAVEKKKRQEQKEREEYERLKRKYDN